MRKHRQGSNFPKIPKIWATIARAFPIDAKILGILGKFDPCRCFRISGVRNFGEIRAWRHFSNLGCENIGRDQISPKFLKPEMRKHRQGSNFPKIPKIWATIARALPIDARIFGILGKFDPCRCFRISGFRNFGEIRAWRHFSNLGCENIGRDQISPKFLAPSLPIDARILGILGKFDPCRCFRISGFRNVGEIRAWRLFSNLGCENIGRDQISPKFLAPSLPIDARILGILGKFDPCRCFRISGFRNFGEIRAWRHFSNLGCENIGRDQISPKFLAPSLPIDARILGILGKFDPCRCFRISGFRNFGGNSSLAAI